MENPIIQKMEKHFSDTVEKKLQSLKMQRSVLQDLEKEQELVTEVGNFAREEEAAEYEAYLARQIEG